MTASTRRASGHSARLTRASASARLLLIAATVVATVSGCTGPSATDAAPAPPSASPPAEAAPPALDASPRAEPAEAEVSAAPAAIAIPAIGVERSLIDLGLAADGSLEVPSDFDDIGWFTGGGRPGAVGPTVIAAHVDSPTGPAAFFRLDELAVGDLIEVTASDGVVHTYRVTERAQYPKDAFPTATVFAASPTDVLRLITCEGTFDRDRGSYLDNLVVTAEPVES